MNHSTQSNWSNRVYGLPPKNLGVFDLKKLVFGHPVEMLFYLYLPIKAPGSTVPHYNGYNNLNRFYPLVQAVQDDLTGKQWRESYVYITAKVMPIDKFNPGNRPGWHCDGFLSDDLNYVWSDCSPTFFYQPIGPICLPLDHVESLREMELKTHAFPDLVTKYADNTLLKLDQYVIHRVGDPTGPMLRSFCKISVSKNKFNLKGNSISSISQGWKFFDRAEVRNHPSKAQGDNE